MMKMRKLFFKLSMLLFVLAMSVNAAWGIDINSMLNGLVDYRGWYYAELTATPSSISGDTVPGQVKLAFTNAEGVEMSDMVIRNALTYGTGMAATLRDLNKNAHDNDPDIPLFSTLDINGDNDFTTYKDEDVVRGFALINLNGVEASLDAIPFSSCAYFKGNARAKDGWYFEGWSYTEGQSDMGKDTIFRCFPTTAAGVYDHFQVYATFQPVLVANYSVNGTMDVTPGIGNSGSNTIVFDVQGEDVDANDFLVTVASPAEGGYAGHGTCATSLAVADGKATVTVTYTTTEAGSGLYRCNVTLASKSGHSSLTAPIYARVANVSEKEASLYEGKVASENLVKSDDLTTLISEATEGQIVALNRDYSSDLLITKDVTLDLNGYTLSGATTVYAANVTIAYSKLGGKITNKIDVGAGTLTMNGGNIEISGMGSLDQNSPTYAIGVASGATLILNGATISISVTRMFAIGIGINGGTAIVNDGTISAHAGMMAAFAVQIGGGGKLIANGGSFNASVDQTDKPDANPADQSTWSNAYAVFVGDASSEAEINGGTFNSSSSYSGAFAVCALGTYGKLTIEKNAIANAYTVRNLPVSYAVGSMGSADLTVNGGYFSATYVKDEQVKPCPPFLCAGFANLDFKAGYIKADSVYVRDAMFEQTASLEQPTLYNVTYKGQEYNEGYRYLAVAEGNDTKAAGVTVARIGTTGYTTLEDALVYANNHSNQEVTIVMENDYTLPEGYYTLPEKATLIVPMQNGQETGYPIINRISEGNNSLSILEANKPYVFRRLTLADGVNIDVHGKIEVSGSQYCSDGFYTGVPIGAYGHIMMKQGSKMTLQDGSEVRAWGFITGDYEHMVNDSVLSGEIDVRRGAVVREQFQMADWKGAQFSVNLIMNGIKRIGHENEISEKDEKYSMFPLTQYYVQNIEVPAKYHPGATLSTTTAVSLNLMVDMTATANDIKVIGVSLPGEDPAIFYMLNEADAENTWVRKFYDAKHDKQVYEINNGAYIGSMIIDLGNMFGYHMQMNSKEFALPITCNFKLHLLSGFMDFTQNTELLPGSEVEVNKESTVTIYTEYEDMINKEGRNPYTGSLYIYDADEWGRYAHGDAYAREVNYTPSHNGQPGIRDLSSAEAIGDASINVKGTFDTSDGYVFTTEHGANIYSNNDDAGTFTFTIDAKDADYVERIWQNDGNYQNAEVKSVQLKNGDGVTPSHATTAGTPAGKSYCYINNKWTLMDIDPDNECFMVDNYGTFYAKPSGYVPVVATKTAGVISGNDDHTFSDASGNGKLYILLDNCQWWEVEAEDGYYHCVHPDNDTYYWWNDARKVDDETVPGWEEKRFTITWKDWNGTIIKTADKDGKLVESYSVTYGTEAVFNGTNPTRAAGDYYKYDFAGWSPALGPVTKDVTYTATYVESLRKYTITFLNEGGTLIERQFLIRDEIPVCSKTPTKAGHILQWSPAIGAVTGDQTYTASWLEEKPATYEITWKNYDGSILQVTTPAADATAEAVLATYTAGEPVGLASSEKYTYKFTGWNPTVAAATANATYVAQFAQSERTYTVNFYKEGTTESTKNVEGNLLASRTGLVYGADAELPIGEGTTKEDAANTYTLEWKDLATKTKSIESVKGKADYVAVFTPTPKKFTVTLTSNLPNACTFTGAGIYKYNNAADALTIAVNYNASSYRFLGWSTAAEPETIISTDASLQRAITGDIALIANLEVIPSMEIAADQTVTLTVPTERTDLVITSNGEDASGQLINAELLTLTGDAHFDLAVNAQDHKWYAVAVPWQVDAEGGVSVNGRTLQFGKDFDILFYDGANRATAGADKSSWKYMEDEFSAGSRIMQPGKLYMIGLMGDASTIRFTKKAGASIITTSTSVEAYASANELDANWNGIANPALFHAYMNAGVTTGQVYDAEHDSYADINLSTEKLVVGQPVFVQAPNAATVVARANTFAAAPARRNARVDVQTVSYPVSLAATDADYACRVTVRVDEDKETDEYVIGQDLAKMGISSKVPQMWVNRYDAKLCINTIAPLNEVAEYPLGIYAPVAGDYVISTNAENEDKALYLTLDGKAIWNLSDGVYVATLEKGTTVRYGLRISAKAPQTATGVDEAVVDAQGETRKVLINNKVFIIRGDKVYSVDGQLVK
jgi:hypothetical protein